MYVCVSVQMFLPRSYYSQVKYNKAGCIEPIHAVVDSELLKESSKST